MRGKLIARPLRQQEQGCPGGRERYWAQVRGIEGGKVLFWGCRELPPPLKQSSALGHRGSGL